MSLPWSSKGLKATPVNADELLIIDSADANPSTQNKRITIGTLPSGILPVPDTTAIVEGSVDATKLLRFEIDGFTTATTRVLTPPDADGILVLEDFGQTLTNKTITAAANILTIASTDLTDTANIVLNNQTNTYTAGVRQNFLGDTAGTSGINVGGIAGNPTTQVDGDVWLNTSSDTLFARINGANVSLTQTPWTSNIDAAGFDLQELDTILDTFGNDVLIFGTSGVASVNNIAIINAVSGAAPQIIALGESNVSLEINGVGSGTVQFLASILRAGLNVGSVASTPSTQVDGDLWLDSATNQLFARINGVDVDISATGSQTPWVSDIDAATFDLTNLSNIEFTTTTGAPGAAVQAIYADAGGIILNVPTADVFLLKINDIGEYSFDATDLDMNQNGLFDVENIVFVETLGAPAGSVHAIYVDTGGMIFNSANTDDFDFQINAVSEYVLTTTQAEWNSNDLIEMGILSFTDVNTSLQQSVSDLLVDVATGGTITLRVNDVTEYTFDSTTADFNSNSIINATIDGDLNTVLDINETQMNVTVGAATTVLTSNGVGIAPTYQAVAGTGDVIGPGSSVDNAIVVFDGVTGKLIKENTAQLDVNSNMTLLRSLQFVSHTSAPSPTIEYIAVVNNDFEINVTTGNNFKLEVNDIVEYEYSATQADFNSNNLIMGAAYIQATAITSPGNSGSATVGRIFLDSGNSNHLTIRRNDGIDVDLEGGSQTPWISNIDADGFDLQDLSNIEFRETTGAPAGTVPAMYHEATGITINVPTGDSLSLDVNAVTEYTFDVTQADWNLNDLIEMGILSFTDVNTSLQQSVSDLLVDVATGGDIVLRVNDVTEYDFSATAADFLSNNLTNMGILSFDDVNTSIQQSASNLQLDVATGGLQEFRINDVIEYTFSSTVSDFLGNNLTNVGFLESNATNPAATGAIRLGNNELASWRNFGNTGDHSITFDDSDDLVISIFGTLDIIFTSAVLDLNTRAIQGVTGLFDVNDNEILTFSATSSAVNEITLVNAATATPVEIRATGDDTDVDVQFTPKGAGTFYGNRETWAWPLTDETTAPTTGVKYTTEPAPYDMSIEDAIAGLTTAGTGAALFTLDVLKETSVNGDVFSSIFTTDLVEIDASEFTSTTAATQPNITTTTWEKGRRLQLSISILDTDGLARGAKISLITHATAK